MYAMVQDYIMSRESDDMITESDLEALVDDQLRPERKTQVEAGIDKNPYLYRKYKELLDQRDLLRLWWKEGVQDNGED